MLEILPVYRFEACRYRSGLVVQERQDKPRKAVLFKSVTASIGHGDGQEAAYPRAGFEK